MERNPVHECMRFWGSMADSLVLYPLECFVLESVARMIRAVDDAMDVFPED